jgi:hypothetical protein
MLVASLPVGFDDSDERLRLICEQTRRRKQHGRDGRGEARSRGSDRMVLIGLARTRGRIAPARSGT